MPLFRRDKGRAVRSFILNLVNGHCLDSHRLGQGPRLESRVNLSLVALIVPVENKELRLDKSLSVVTKEFSTTGVSVVLNGPSSLDEVIVGFCQNSEITFARAKARHLSPMGGGFFQLGLEMTEIVSPTKYPALSGLENRF